jgi:hypothetical protein
MFHEETEGGGPVIVAVAPENAKGGKIHVRYTLARDFWGHKKNNQK